MGHRHSSAPLGSPSEFCSAGSGAHEPAQEPNGLSRATVWVLLAGIRFYQAVLSSLMFSACKFYPSCSHYAAEAIARHGALRGVRQATGRLLRCRPFTAGGFDPVPDLAEETLAEPGHEALTEPIHKSLHGACR